MIKIFFSFCKSKTNYVHDWNASQNVFTNNGFIGIFTLILSTDGNLFNPGHICFSFVITEKACCDLLTNSTISLSIE